MRQHAPIVSAMCDSAQTIRTDGPHYNLGSAEFMKLGGAQGEVTLKEV